MAIIPQPSLFQWEDIQGLGDLDRLRLVLEYMPDEGLMVVLENERGRGRNDYPVRAMWNSLLAGIVFQHESVQKLRRELGRNGQLRYMCGFGDHVPPPWAYTRFLKRLLANTGRIEAMFDDLVRQMAALLPDFGKDLAIDSKAIPSFAKHKNKQSDEKPDGRRDVDANYGMKTYKGIRENGTVWQKVVSWFGYKLHLIVDATYELPFAFSVTKASRSDVKEGHSLVEELAQTHPSLLKTVETMSGDKGYDDGKLITKLWDEHRIKPVIAIRNLWKDPDPTRLLNGRENVIYDYKGTVSCVCPTTGTVRTMCNGGFEKDRDTLKKICPAKQMGSSCKGMSACPVVQGIRIPLSEDRRVFTPIDRSSYKWERAYNKRTSVERLFSRLDVSFGFEVHTIRGLKKMELRCGLALCVMLAMAVGRVWENEQHRMRSLVA